MKCTLADMARGVICHTWRKMECHNLRCHDRKTCPPEWIKNPSRQAGQITGDLHWPTVTPTGDIASARWRSAPAPVNASAASN